MKFTREQRIINALVLHSSDVQDIGLLHGKLGISIYFYFLSCFKNNEFYSKIADELVDNVIESLNDEILLDFESGITGIGWGLEYLHQLNFIKIDSDEIFYEFDSVICDALDNGNMDCEKLISIGYYSCKRLDNYRRYYSSDCFFRLKNNISIILSYFERNSLNEEFIISSEMIDLLYKIKKLNLFNSRVVRYLDGVSSNSIIMEYVLPKIERKTFHEINRVYNLKDKKTQYAGFDMVNIPENERWGLKSGIAGYGLQKLLYEYMNLI